MLLVAIPSELLNSTLSSGGHRLGRGYLAVHDGPFAFTDGEIAEVALFLASSHARWITGQTIAVDGGQLLNV